MPAWGLQGGGDGGLWYTQKEGKCVSLRGWFGSGFEHFQERVQNPTSSPGQSGRFNSYSFLAVTTRM